MVNKKKVSPKTKSLLRGALGLFTFTFLLFLRFVVRYQLKSDAVLFMFFLYGALYAGWFWLCTQIAYKLKNLKLGIILFVAVIVLVFLGAWLLLHFG